MIDHYVVVLDQPRVGSERLAFTRARRTQPDRQTNLRLDDMMPATEPSALPHPAKPAKTAL